MINVIPAAINWNQELICMECETRCAMRGCQAKVTIIVALDANDGAGIIYPGCNCHFIPRGGEDDDTQNQVDVICHDCFLTFYRRAVYHSREGMDIFDLCEYFHPNNTITTILGI